MMLKINPWSKIESGAQIMVPDTNGFDVYWSVEKDGKYSISIHVKDKRIKDLGYKLKGMKIDIFFTRNQGFQWVLILENRHAWEIFYRLCEDLISVTADAKNEIDLIQRMHNRLKRWQELLAKEYPRKLSLPLQMGLFSELDYLYNHLAPIMTLEKAVDAWVGSENDKQDFITDAAAVEVKSYRTTKGKFVSISSAQQLVSEKDNLYMATYALTTSDNGDNINTLYSRIKENISDYMVSSFEEKVFNVGYSPFIHGEEDLANFIIDNKEFYHVNEDFPKLMPEEIDEGIVSVNYQVDLAKCGGSLISEDKMNIE